MEDGPGVAGRVVVDWTGTMDDDDSDGGPCVDSEDVDVDVAARVRALACNLSIVVIGTRDPVQSSLVFFVSAKLLWPRPFSLPNNSLMKVVKIVRARSVTCKIEFSVIDHVWQVAKYLGLSAEYIRCYSSRAVLGPSIIHFLFLHLSSPLPLLR
jgi:hypothetical protein